MKRYLLLLVLLLTGCHTGVYQGPVSDHFDGKKFYYPGEKDKEEHRTALLYNLLVAVFQHPWSKALPPMQFTRFPDYPKNIKITYINHSSVLIQANKVNFLIDPVYSERVSPFQWIGPKRVRGPGVKFTELPNIDVVLISHNHYDHLDLSTLKHLDKVFHPLFVVPLGNKVFLKNYGIYNVAELDWWEEVKIKNAIVTFLPAHHSAQRWLNDYNQTLWGSYGLKVGDKKIYFSGDTGYSTHFKTIRERWGRPDFSFIPIGAYEPRSLLKYDHLDPAESVQCHLDLESQESMGIHWGTFQLSAESIDQPLKDLADAIEKAHLEKNKFFVIREGEPLYIPLVDGVLVSE